MNMTPPARLGYFWRWMGERETILFKYQLMLYIAYICVYTYVYIFYFILCICIYMYGASCGSI